MPRTAELVDEEIPSVPRDEDLIEEDGEPLESDWHRLAMNLLIELTYCHMGEREDYFAGGNMFIYYDEKLIKQMSKKKKFRGPDYFFVHGVPLNPTRRYWVVWKEAGRYPNLIIELGSPSTIKIDRTTKKDIYEQIFQLHEYFVFNPADNTLQGWRMQNGKFVAIEPNEQGWLWCEELGLWIGTWQGKVLGKPNVYLRFYDSEGQLILTSAEMEKKRGNAERQRADAEKQRADAAEAEVARLRARNGKNGKNGGKTKH